MMLQKIHLPIIYALLIGLASLLKAEEPPGQQLLLLRNGQALEGRISRSGDVYRITLPDGEIRIKAADVELVCKDIEDGYQRKRAAIPLGSLPEHLELAQWCQRHKLYDHSAAELADAAAIAPNNPLVKFFQRRLQTNIEPRPIPPKAEIAREQSLSNEELDRMIRGLPHKTIENFKQSVQPLLLNSCTASGCHGPQSESGLRLERISFDQPVGRRLTQRNIYAVMQYVDRDNPLASRILTVPTAPHGTAKTAIFTERQAMQYKRLLDWVMQLGPADMPETTPTILNNDSMLAETIPEAGATTVGATAGLSSSAVGTPSLLPANAGIKPRILSQDARKARPMPTPNRDAIPAEFHAPVSTPSEVSPAADSDLQRSKVKRGASPREFTPRDSFDPEIFNRRYSKPTSPDHGNENQ